MPEQLPMMGQQQARAWFLFSCAASAMMFLVITIASCTSNETFSHIYKLVTEFLSLSRTTLSTTLRASPYLGHFLCYTLLSLSLSGVFSRRNKYLAPLVAVAFGTLMEAVQIFIPSRDSSLLDIGVNILGIAVGLALYGFWVTHRRRSHQVR